MNQVIRRISTYSTDIYLTFDDGPDPVSTPLILDVLKKNAAMATFYVIAKKAKAHPQIISRILREGHQIGNHSLDHNFKYYFGSQRKLKNWIEAAEESFEEILPSGVHSQGFRPPAGVVTPPLKKTLSEMNLPIVLWSQRFFDRAFPFTQKKALKAAKKLAAGDILLLHDLQSSKRLPEFLKALECLVATAKKSGLTWRPLLLKKTSYKKSISR